MPCCLGSPSETVNLAFYASAMMSFMYWFRRVHSSPKKNSRSGSLPDSCSFEGSYFTSSSSFRASSYRFFTEIFNVPYCPQFNGIESYFSQIKATYKKMLLKCVIEEVPYDTVSLIKESIQSISDENVKRCVRYALA